MHLRPLQRRDIPEIADLSAESQLEDELVAFVSPARQRYYASFRNGFVRRTYARSLMPGWVIWVAETDENDETTTHIEKPGLGQEPGGRVVGYAAWTRVGHSPVARNWQRMNEGRFTSQSPHFTSDHEEVPPKDQSELLMRRLPL